ncbi:hypothetical protein Leryth_001855, partial [Lithospermum erythrorhizon]
IIKDYVLFLFNVISGHAIFNSYSHLCLTSVVYQCILIFLVLAFTTYRFRQCEQIRCFRTKKTLTRATKRGKHSSIDQEGKDLVHLLWWKERMQNFRKPSSLLLVQRLTYTNLLGLDPNLRNGSLKEGTLNWEMLMFKSKFPREVLLCRVGDFYEAIGIDACILVEYAGLNPFGGFRSDSIPKAGCPVV